MVDLQDYYMVVNLDHLRHWFNPTAEPLWLDVEKGLTGPPIIVPYFLPTYGNH